MAKAKFAYDESGSTFFCFVLSFIALILVPSTYYLWPKEVEKDETKCRCSGCQSKKQHLFNQNKWKRSRRKLIRGAIVVGWILFAVVTYKCATIQNEYVNWDPFEILGIREDASVAEIKKAYHAWSLILHPDKKSGDADKFMQVNKAYRALTNEESRKNWLEYGNPDGPGATTFGIALPSWIVEKENSVVVLGIYALIFMVALPVSVGLWWYKSIKYGNDKVLIATSEVYYHFIHKTPDMIFKRVIMILAASLEFCKTHNPEVIERPSDNEELPRLISYLPKLNLKKEEKLIGAPYSVKARAIIHAHLSRLKLPQSTLEVDRCMITSKCTHLLQEFVQCVSQLITLALSGRIREMPTLKTLENAMKLSPLIVQALWEYESPLLQLPHFNSNTLRHFEKKKIKIRTIEQIAKMKEKDRREALKNFTDDQYQDIMSVISDMPLLNAEARCEVLDDEDPSVITAGSIVTVVVKLTRKFMRDVFEKEDRQVETIGNETGKETEATTTADETDANATEDDNIENTEPNNNSTDQEPLIEKKSNSKSNNQKPKSDSSLTDNDKVKSAAMEASSNSDDDDEWDRKFQEKVLKKQKVFESKPKKSHPVHCPYYPEDKQEFWWVYVVDRKRMSLVTAPLLVTSLVDTEEIELKFTAPPRPGTYSYTVIVRSDSYVDSTIQRPIRVDIKPAKEYIEVPYEIPEEEMEEEIEEESAVEDSDLLTDTDED